MLEAVRVVGEIQQAAKVNGQEKSPEPNRVLETVETIRAVKELMPPQPPASTENQTLQSIVQLMIAQSERSQKQSDALLNMLLTQMTKPQQPAADSRTSIKEIVALVKDDVLPLIG